MDQQKLEAYFSALIVSIGHSAAMAMGYGVDPDAEDKPDKNLSLAAYNIDLLLLLKEKTKNNLTPEEQRLLDQVIADLQMKFIQTRE